VSRKDMRPSPTVRCKGGPSSCFLQEYDSIGVKQWGCAKDVILWELGEKQLKVDPSTTLRASSLKLKRERFGELNAETQSAQRVRGRGGMKEEGRGRVPECEEGAGWNAMFTLCVTATRDNLSRYFLCSNDSNGARMGRKLIGGMGMRGKLVRGNDGCVGSVKPCIF
jgi:hypothetical protein